MWPFRKKERLTKLEETDLTPMTFKNTASLGLPVFPSVPIEQNYHESIRVPDKSLEKLPVDLQSITAIELKNLAKDQGLKGYSTLNKDDLIDLLKCRRKAHA